MIFIFCFAWLKEKKYTINNFLQNVSQFGTSFILHPRQLSSSSTPKAGPAQI